MRRSILVFLLLVIVAVGSVGANPQPAGTPVAEAEKAEQLLSLQQHLEQIETAVLARFEDLAARRQASLPPLDRRTEAAELRRQIDQIRGRAGRWRLHDDPQIERRLFELWVWADYLERSESLSDELVEGLLGRRISRPRALPKHRDRPLVRGVAPANDHCADAIVLGSESLFGDTSSATSDGADFCSDSTSPDVWYRYSQPFGGEVFFRVVADFSPAVSVSTGCPGSGFGVTCQVGAENGALVGSFFADAGQSFWLRIAGEQVFESGPFEIELGPGGTVEGRVTDAQSGQPLASIGVRVISENGSFGGEARTGLDGLYRIPGLSPGRYFAYIDDSFDYTSEVFEELPCAASFDCGASSGTPIDVELGAITSGIDFTLELGGSIAGQVTRAVDAQAPEIAELTLFDSAGNTVAFEFADSAGSYRFGGLDGGSYFLKVRTFGNLLDALYDGFPCRFDCDPVTGTPIEVALGAETAGIDFVLDSLGIIQGTVLGVDLAPLGGVLVRVLDAAGEFVGSTSTGIDGTYEVAGLLPGDYFVLAGRNLDPYLDQLYDGADCIGGCNLADATPVTVAENSTREGIDFRLRRLGSVSGTVLARVTQTPISGTAFALNQDGQVVNSSFFSDGQFEIVGLPPGTYRIAVEANGFQSQLWDGVACPQLACDVASGTAINLTLDEEVEGVDFELEALGRISGRVTEAATGIDLFSDVVIYDSAGSQVQFTFANPGTYLSEGLQPGTYFVSTFGFSDYQNQLYDGIPCSSTGCEPTLGMPIEVGLGEVVENIDFALVPLGRITGEILDANTGLPIFEEQVELFDSSGSFVRSTSVFGDNYEFANLYPGTYAVVAGGQNYEQVLYPNVPCPNRDCDLVAGATVEVVLDQTTAGIDFSLVLLPTIEGHVTRDGGNLNSLEQVCIYDEVGNQLSCRFTTSSGSYRLTLPVPGTYFAMAFDNFDDLVADVFGGPPCGPSTCDPTDGTAIELERSGSATDIDFVLPQPSSLAAEVVDRRTGVPVDSGLATFWYPSGEQAFTSSLSPVGTLELPRIELGTYYLTLDLEPPYEDLLYDGLPCPDGGCDPTLGTPIVVSPGDQTALTIRANSTAPGTCTAGDEALCLAAGRFLVKANWRRPSGLIGEGQVVPLSTDSGYFWFFDADNVEMVVKVLDACAGRERFWVFAAGLTNVEVTLTVIDTWTDTEKVYLNPLGSPFQPIQDTEAFATCAAPPPAGAQIAPVPEPEQDPPVDEFSVLRQLDALLQLQSGLGSPVVAPEIVLARPSNAKGVCQPTLSNLCLADGRFEVRALWTRPNGETGFGRAVTLTDDTGYFWFFDSANTEAVVKVLDACSGRDRFWVFAAGLTNVEVVLRVTDTLTGSFNEYVNPQGTAFEPVQDTEAFATCQ